MAETDNHTHDVFLSYAHEDKATVQSIASKLERKGIKVWFDSWEIDAGEITKKRILEGLYNSRKIVVFTSKNSRNSDWVEFEYLHGSEEDILNKKQKIIPVKLDKEPVPPHLNILNYIDWTADQNAAFKQLLSACEPNKTSNKVLPSPEIELLESILNRPLFDIKNYDWYYESLKSPVVTSSEKLIQWKYRKFYRTNEKGSLISLNLANCNLKNISFLGNYPQIQHLNIGGNNIISYEPLQHLKRLKSLNISSTRISNTENIAHLTNLHHLDLSYCQLPDYTFLADFRELRTLNLTGNRIQDYSFLLNLENLVNLNLFDTGFTNGEFLTHLENLKALSLGANFISFTSFFTSLQDLQSIDLSSSRISDYSFLRNHPNLKTLDLSNNSIADTSFLKSLPQLETLNMRSTFISDATFLHTLNQIRNLNLSSNFLSNLTILTNLLKLNSLNISENRISDFSFLKSLSNLRALDISENRIFNFSFLKNVSNLRTLSLRNTQITDLSILDCLCDIQSLDLRRNSVADASPLRNHTQIQLLALSQNLIADASFLTSLDRISTVSLTNNEIKTIPDSLLEKDIEVEENKDYEILPGSFNWHGNPVELPPIEILRRGHQSIKDFLAAGKTQPLSEAKLLVVGEAGVGKTSLIKQIRGEPFNIGEETTHDIVRHRHRLRCGTKGEIDLRIWDFGGQEIMHATHQFFLTQRSVYLLVLNSRQNENQCRIDYWMRLIESFGANAPVIVVCNQCDQQKIQINWSLYKKKYPQIKHYVEEVSCYVDQQKGIDKREGISEAIERIAEVIENDLEEVGEPVPVTWFNVKRELEKLTNDGTDYLRRSRFNELCSRKHVKPGAEDTLLRFLHDLGVVLHFDREHPILKQSPSKGFDSRILETKVLNPAWVTAGIYCILNDRKVITNRGFVEPSDLARILQQFNNRNYSIEQQDFIIEVMHQFELCFAMSDPMQGWLIPDLLPKDEPDTGDWSNSLGFRYEYPVLPSSIMSRFIVAMNQKRLISKNTYWRHGVVLINDGIRALVRADEQDGIITVSLLETKDGNADDRRRFLYAIRTEFKRIHSGFSEKFEVEEFAESTTHKGVFYDYQELLDMEKAQEKEVWVKELKRKVPISDFLDGVIIDRQHSSVFDARNDNRLE